MKTEEKRKLKMEKKKVVIIVLQRCKRGPTDRRTDEKKDQDKYIQKKIKETRVFCVWTRSERVGKRSKETDRLTDGHGQR